MSVCRATMYLVEEALAGGQYSDEPAGVVHT